MHNTAVKLETESVQQMGIPTVRSNLPPFYQKGVEGVPSLSPHVLCLGPRRGQYLAVLEPSPTINPTTNRNDD